MTALVEVGSGRQALVLAASVAGCRASVLGQGQAPASLALPALGAIGAFSVRLYRARYQGRPTALGSARSTSNLPCLHLQPQPASYTRTRAPDCARL